MGFFSFNEQYYISELDKLESRRLDAAGLYEVKQILKVLDDLADEGYHELNQTLEKRHHVLTRLRKILSAHGETPFAIQRAPIPPVHYGDGEHEVRALCGTLISTAKGHPADSENPFLDEIYDYCQWLGYEAGTAYVFLLRDAFLPFVYFQSRGRRGLYPWLIGRAFLSHVSGVQDLDDQLRLPIYEALENGVTEFSSFQSCCKERVRAVLRNVPALERALLELLQNIPEEKIVVVESGYCGTIPITLSALDPRVDFRLFTTAPFLYETYRDRIFCRGYETIRSFETLYSQDILMKFSSYRQGKFYVRLAEDAGVMDKAAGEIRRFTAVF